MSRYEKLITREFVLSRLNYNPRTGEFHWKNPQTIRVKEGDLAGNISKTTGYRNIGILGHTVPASRLAFLVMTASWPVGFVDHKDRSRDNNAWENLRLCTVSQNAANSGPHKDSIHGFKGVHQHLDGRWRAVIYRKGKRKHLGLFEDPATAHEAYLNHAEHMDGEFFNGGENRKT